MIKAFVFLVGNVLIYWNEPTANGYLLTTVDIEVCECPKNHTHLKDKYVNDFHITDTISFQIAKQKAACGIIKNID